MKPRRKGIMLALIGLLAVSLALFWYFIMPFSAVGVPMIVDRAVTPDGAEMLVTQTFTGTAEPYVVSLFARRLDGDWTKYYLDHQAIFWRGQLAWDSGRGVMVVLRYGSEFATYDPFAGRVVLTNDRGSKARGPMGVVSDPLAHLQPEDEPISPMGVGAGDNESPHGYQWKK